MKCDVSQRRTDYFPGPYLRSAYYNMNRSMRFLSSYVAMTALCLSVSGSCPSMVEENCDDDAGQPDEDLPGGSPNTPVLILERHGVPFYPASSLRPEGNL